MKDEGIITMERLKELCNAYDDVYGSFPESQYEGEGVLEYILETYKPQLQPSPWIKIEPGCEMPEYGVKVDILSNGKDRLVNHIFEFDMWESLHITHWMKIPPLPEA